MDNFEFLQDILDEGENGIREFNRVPGGPKDIVISGDANMVTIQDYTRQEVFTVEKKASKQPIPQDLRDLIGEIRRLALKEAMPS